MTAIVTSAHSGFPIVLSKISSFRIRLGAKYASGDQNFPVA